MDAKTIQQFVDAATLIFKGAVRSLAASIMPEVPVSDDVAVVTVDTVIAAAPMLGDLKGTALTIRFAGAERPKVGDQAIFFTNAWIYGTHLAVAEVGRVEPAREADVVSAVKKRPDRQLAARIAGAEFVVVGVVEKVGPAPDVHEPISLHSPSWKLATLRVESVNKGKLTGRRLEVLFASSDDVMWESAPKLQEGQEGIFLLRRGEGPFAPAEAFTVVEPLDVQPRGALPRVAKLIETSK